MLKDEAIRKYPGLFDAMRCATLLTEWLVSNGTYHAVRLFLSTLSPPRRLASTSAPFYPVLSNLVRGFAIHLKQKDMRLTADRHVLETRLGP